MCLSLASHLLEDIANLEQEEWGCLHLASAMPFQIISNYIKSAIPALVEYVHASYYVYVRGGGQGSGARGKGMYIYLSHRAHVCAHIPLIRFQLFLSVVCFCVLVLGLSFARGYHQFRTRRLTQLMYLHLVWHSYLIQLLLSIQHLPIHVKLHRSTLPTCRMSLILCTCLLSNTSPSLKECCNTNILGHALRNFTSVLHVTVRAPLTSRHQVYFSSDFPTYEDSVGRVGPTGGLCCNNSLPLYVCLGPVLSC